LTFSTGVRQVISWVYGCPKIDCPGAFQIYRSCQAERVHLKYRRFSRELVVRIGYQCFWQHQTRDEVYAWLTHDLHLDISEREISYLVIDFLALLKAAQPAQIQHKLQGLKGLIIGIDGMQPEKGNDCLYLVRELQCGVTLLAENLEESSQTALEERLFEPLNALAKDLKLPWMGVISDDQEALRLATAHSFPGVPYQACQSHCLRDAGQLTFEADRSMKKALKASFRSGLGRLRPRIWELPLDDPYRAILLDYSAILRSTLLEGGVAPFELGGIQVFEALANLEASLLRCQKKATTSCCAAWSFWRSGVSRSQSVSNAIGDSASGSSIWNICWTQSASPPKPVRVLRKRWSAI
jgi:hypothetical protein